MVESIREEIQFRDRLDFDVDEIVATLPIQNDDSALASVETDGDSDGEIHDEDDVTSDDEYAPTHK
jgi:hypothetical protein